LPVGIVLRGWARCASGYTAEGISSIDDGIKDYRVTGSILTIPFSITLKAEALHLSDRTSEALEAIKELRELVRTCRVRIPFLAMREKFTGGCQFLKTLQQDLTAGTALVVAQPISVHADGGVGKTALAVELGWRLFEARLFDFVLFLNASTPETLDAELASLCASDALDLPEQTAKEQETRRARRDALFEHC
jgi:hypothetical protein